MVAGRRLYSYRRGLQKQIGAPLDFNSVYNPTRQQDVISAGNLVQDLTGQAASENAKRQAQARRDAQANLMAGQKLASEQGIVKVRTTVYSTILTAIGQVQLLVPQNLNRLFLYFVLAKRLPPTATNSVVFTFGPPVFLNVVSATAVPPVGVLLYNLPDAGTGIELKLTEGMYGPSVPIDDIFVWAGSPQCGVAVFEGTSVVPAP